MKKITLYIFAVCIFSAIGGCSDEGNNLLPPCDPAILGEFFSDQVGILTLTDTIGQLPLPNPRYYIYSQSITHLPLKPCNLPETEYHLNEGDKMDILFSGYVEMSGPIIQGDALSIQIELTMIQKLNPKDE